MGNAPADKQALGQNWGTFSIFLLCPPCLAFYAFFMAKPLLCCPWHFLGRERLKFGAAREEDNSRLKVTTDKEYKYNSHAKC